MILLALFAPLAAAQECPTQLHPSDFDPGASLILDSDQAPTSAFCGGGGAYSLEVYAASTLLGKQHVTPPGTTADLGAYMEGDELVVTLYVPETGQTFYTGPAWRNPDNQFHGSVSEIEPGLFLVGFTDRYGGGGSQYDNQDPYLYTDVSVVIAVDAHLERLPDTDGDGIANDVDVCLYDDDLVDVNADSIPDCLQVDSDHDGVPDVDDQCPGADDLADTNASGVPDCVEVAYDADLDGVLDGDDACPGYDDHLDADSSGFPDCLENAYDLVITDTSVQYSYCSDTGNLTGQPLTWTISLPPHEALWPYGTWGGPTTLGNHVAVGETVIDVPSLDSGYWYTYGYGDSVQYYAYDESTRLFEANAYLVGPQLADGVSESAIALAYGNYYLYLEDWQTGRTCFVQGWAETAQVVNRGDLDDDGVPNPYDACEGDDFAGDSDADGVCDDRDVCEGDDGIGDTDGDGACDDLDVCATDIDKVEPGDCGCGTPDSDTDADGVTDCLEEELVLDGRRSLLYFDTRKPSQSYAQFTGTLELGGGLLAPDLREGNDGVATAEVLVGAVTVFDGGIDFDVHQAGVGTDDLEQWRYRQSAQRQASIQFKNSQKYNSERDAAMPGMNAANLGRLRSRYVHTDETRLRFRWNERTTLPLTLAVDGVAVLTVTAYAGTCVDGGLTTCLDGYAVTSAYDVFEVLSDHGERIVDVDYTGDRLGDGNIMAWYADGDAADGLTGLLHSHEAIDDGSSSSVWYNAGGRFDLILPLQGTGVSASATDRNATLTLQLGGANTAAAVEGSVTFVDYDRTSNKTSTTWRSREVDEDGDCLWSDNAASCEDED